MQQIADWLQKLGMSEYAERFVENRIDLSVLRDLTDQDLKDLGVVLGDRRRMLRAIGELGGAAPAQVATAVPSAPRETAERRQLTVMFCDLVGSTALSARLDPEDLRAIIGAYHRCCTEAITKSGGFVAKYMGDGVLAYFGYPQAHEEDAERAVRAGLALTEAVPKLDGQGGTALQVRIGIATGLVVVGDLLGEGAAQEQAVVGETPNLAARLQALAGPGVVVISDSTRRLTVRLFEYRDLGTVALKGLAETVPAWQVLGLGSAESRFEALRTATTPLVGRVEEIELLLRRWEQAKSADGQVVLVAGEPGIGKSRIAQAIVERISAEPHTRLRYFCSPHHQDSALYPSISQLEHAAGFRREDTDDQRLAKLEAVLAQGTNDLSEAVPLLADLLSIPTGDRYPPLNLTPQKRKERTLRAQIAQIEGLAARQPVLMLWEDVHWSDPTTRESLDLIIDRIPTLKVLVIITFRPEFTPPWVGRPHVTLLTLSRLPARQRAEMIVHVTGGKALPKEVAAQIVDRTDGVPLFIEELTKSVIESGIVTEADGRYAVAGPVAPLAIPTSLHASLLARLDRLAPTREIAQIGAALGRSFSHELISAVAQMPPQKLDDALAQLVSAELIFRRGTPPDAEYTFKHALVQDAAYSTLLRSRRHQIHARIAATLESQFPEILAAQPQLVAQHCGEAGLNGKAIAYWLKAGHQAVARSANVEAIAHFTRGLEMLRAMPDAPERLQQELDLQAALGPALITTRGFAAPEVEQAYGRARDLCRQVGDTPQLFPILWGLWAFYLVRADLLAARETVDQLLQLAQSAEDSALLLVAHRAMGTTFHFLGEFGCAQEHEAQGISLDDPQRYSSLARLYAEHPGVVCRCFAAHDLWYLGYPDRALMSIQDALALAQQLAHPFMVAHAVDFAAWLHLYRREGELTQQQAEADILLATEHNIAFFLAHGTILRGWALVEQGQGTEGIAQMRQGLAAYRSTGAEAERPFWLGLLAEAYGKVGQPDEGMVVLTAALAEVQKGWRFCEAELNRLKGELLLGLSAENHAEAETCFHQAFDIARHQQAKSLELRTAVSLGRLWRDQGKRAEARDLLAPVYGWFTEGFGTRDLKEAKALLNELAS